MSGLFSLEDLSFEDRLRVAFRGDAKAQAAEQGKLRKERRKAASGVSSEQPFLLGRLPGATQGTATASNVFKRNLGTSNIFKRNLGGTGRLAR